MRTRCHRGCLVPAAATVCLRQWRPSTWQLRARPGAVVHPGALRAPAPHSWTFSPWADGPELGGDPCCPSGCWGPHRTPHWVPLHCTPSACCWGLVQCPHGGSWSCAAGALKCPERLLEGSGLWCRVLQSPAAPPGRDWAGQPAQVGARGPQLAPQQWFPGCTERTLTSAWRRGGYLALGCSQFLTVENMGDLLLISSSF